MTYYEKFDWINLSHGKLSRLNAVLRVVDKCSKNEYFVLFICTLCRILLMHFAVCVQKNLSSLGF